MTMMHIDCDLPHLTLRFELDWLILKWRHGVWLYTQFISLWLYAHPLELLQVSNLVAHIPPVVIEHPVQQWWSIAYPECLTAGPGYTVQPSFSFFLGGSWVGMTWTCCRNRCLFNTTILESIIVILSLYCPTVCPERPPYWQLPSRLCTANSYMFRSCCICFACEWKVNASHSIRSLPFRSRCAVLWY